MIGLISDKNDFEQNVYFMNQEWNEKGTLLLVVIHLFNPVDIFFGIVDFAIYSFVILESKDL